MFFCAVKGWQYHPGNRDQANLTTAESARIADHMLDEYLRREESWDGWQPHKSQAKSQTRGYPPPANIRPTELTFSSSESNKTGKP